jgi:hypothetical protein
VSPPSFSHARLQRQFHRLREGEDRSSLQLQVRCLRTLLLRPSAAPDERHGPFLPDGGYEDEAQCDINLSPSPLLKHYRKAVSQMLVVGAMRRVRRGRKSS